MLSLPNTNPRNIPNLLLINRCKLEEGKKILGGRLAGAAPGIDNPCPQGYLLFITVACLGFSDGDNDTVIISSSGGTYEKQTQNFHQGADFVIKTHFEFKMFFFFNKNIYICCHIIIFVKIIHTLVL